MIAKFKESLLELIDSPEMHPASESAPTVLLAVSGGIDSMCMAYLFSRIYYSNYAIATINFSLRGEESDGDENLVLDWANKQGVKCYTNTFDTISYASHRGISTQMAARDLRYNWFDSLIKEHSFDYLAIAHNLNDSVETFFINTLRGTGLQGLTGIRKKSGNIIRPLMGFTRKEIAEFVKEENIPFREDSSNAESNYARNRLRNLVFPEFEMINQSFLKTLERDISNVEAAVDVLEELYIEKRALFIDESSSRISIEALLNERRPDFWLYQILTEFGFNPDQIAQVHKSLTGQPGKEFHSQSHLLIKDRDYLLLYPKGGGLPKEGSLSNKRTGALELQTNNIEVPSLEIGEKAQFECCNQKVELSLYPKPKGFRYKKRQPPKSFFMRDLFSESEESLFSKGNVNKSPTGGESNLSSTSKAFVENMHSSMPEPLLCVDANLIKFPLTLRVWKDGDRFMPLGMRGFKKLSDFMVDLKLDVVTKNRIPILLSGDKIVAIIGYRIDERFKVTSTTKNILEIKIIL